MPQNAINLSGSVEKHIQSLELERALQEAFQFEPTEGQRRFFHAFSRFASSDKPRCALLLKGYAGTGKTTLLKEIIQTTHKNTVVVAPTGIAALNAGGVTIHSMFQLPFGGFLPDNSSMAPKVGSSNSRIKSP